MDWNSFPKQLLIQVSMLRRIHTLSSNMKYLERSSQINQPIHKATTLTKFFRAIFMYVENQRGRGTTSSSILRVSFRGCSCSAAKTTTPPGGWKWAYEISDITGKLVRPLAPTWGAWPWPHLHRAIKSYSILRKGI